MIPRRSATRFDWLEKYGTAEARLAGVTESTNVGKEVMAKLGARPKKTSPDGILGYDVLKQFVVTIDYQHSLLHLGVPAE